jgi:hypothetical protein
MRQTLLTLRVFVGALQGVLLCFEDVSERNRREKLVKSQLEELQRWHAVTLDHEDRVQELKCEVNA